MSDEQKLKLFLSWSGDLSRTVAVALRSWLPNLFDTVTPWASDTDIAAGQRGLNQIANELQGTRFGIIVVTQENQGAPWLNFEAGALSKVITSEQDQRVAPLLVDISSPVQLTGPLAQFQAKVLRKDGMHEVVRSIAEAAELAPTGVDARFQAFWPQLEEQVEQAIEQHAEPGVAVERRPAEDLLEEALTHIRALRSDQETVLSALTGARLSQLPQEVRFQGQRSIVDKVARIAKRMGVEVEKVQPRGSSVESGYAVIVSPNTDVNMAVNFEGVLSEDPGIRSLEVPVQVFLSEGAAELD